MKKITRDELSQLSLDDLLNLLSPEFNISKTYFDNPYKQYMVTHNYSLVGEVNDEEDNVDDWETFGYPIELLKLAKTPSVYGSTAKLALINFFEVHPEHLIVKA